MEGKQLRSEVVGSALVHAGVMTLSKSRRKRETRKGERRGNITGPTKDCESRNRERLIRIQLSRNPNRSCSVVGNGDIQSCGRTAMRRGQQFPNRVGKATHSSPLFTEPPPPVFL